MQSIRETFLALLACISSIAPRPTPRNASLDLLAALRFVRQSTGQETGTYTTGESSGEAVYLCVLLSGELVVTTPEVDPAFVASLLAVSVPYVICNTLPALDSESETAADANTDIPV
jgi:hypothetical protein